MVVCREIILMHRTIFTFCGFSRVIELLWASLVAQLVKNPPAMRETWLRSLGWDVSLEKQKANHSSILTWRIPWTIPWGRQELDMTERLSPSLFTLNDCYVYLFVCFAFN